MLALCLKEATVRFKPFAIVAALFVLCGVVSAQGYDIRTTSRNNLRAAPSLDGTFLETVPAGTVLHVVGRQNRWLKISRNGNEVWMADWVGYSRVETSAGTAPQSASNVPAHVDNCCFVDRQCHSAQDWENGYWAFQNGQCAAPAPAQPAQPAGNVPAQVDNCCFVDRQCHTDAQWTDGYHAFQTNQCPVSAGAQPGPGPAAISLSTPNMTEGVKRFLADPSIDPFNNCCYMHHNTCHNDDDWRRGAWQFQNHQCVHPAPLWTRPVIVGNDSPLGAARFTDYVNGALELIGIHAPEWLRYIDVSGVRQIEPLVGSEMVLGGFFNQQWLVGLAFDSWQQEHSHWETDLDYILNYASIIAHEACHAIKQRTYTQTAGWANELPCTEAGAAVARAIRAGSRNVG